MELLQLYYFQVTARHEHITAAARELHIAQPALSQTIRRLENELGTPLFDRMGKHIRLNECGRIFLKYTDIALNALSDAKSEISDAAGNPNHPVVLGVQAASWLLPDILGKFGSLYPQIHFQIFQTLGASDRTADIDLTIEASALPNPKAGSCILLREPLLAALPAAHPLASQPVIRLSQLSGQPFASLYPGSNLYKITKYYCNMAGFDPEISLSCDNPQTFRELLGLNMGVALIPSITWPDMHGSRIVTRPVTEPQCSRCILLTWDEHRYLNSSAVLLRSFLTQYFQELSPDSRTSSQTGASDSEL